MTTFTLSSITIWFQNQRSLVKRRKDEESTMHPYPQPPLEQPMNAGPQNRTPENSMYAHYPTNPQFPQGMHNSRLSGSGGQFGFPQTPGPTNQGLGAGVSNPNVPPNRNSFNMSKLTPVQQFDFQRNGNFSHFMSASMSHQPSRPSSQPPNMHGMGGMATNP